MTHLIICTAPDGYRRAGLVLAQGQNLVEAALTAEQLDELRGDPRTVLVERDILPAELVRAIEEGALARPDVPLPGHAAAALRAEGRAEAEAEAEAKADALAEQVGADIAELHDQVRDLTAQLAAARAAMPPAAAEAAEGKPAPRKKAS